MGLVPNIFVQVAVVIGEEETIVLLFCLWAGTIVQVVHAFFQQKWRNENNIKERKTMNKMKDTREILFFLFCDGGRVGVARGEE
jgi:hypothetical protein